MAAATTAQLIEAREPAGLREIGVNATEILYKGTMCFVGAADGMATAAIAANIVFGGIVRTDVGEAGSADGDFVAEVYTRGAFWLPLAGAVAADVGDKVYATTNNDLTKTASTNPIIGRINAWRSGMVEVELDIQPA